MKRLAACLVLIGGTLWLTPVSLAQEDAIQAELDAYWAEVVRSVVEWDLEAQKSAYHPDAISAFGDADSYSTRLMAELYEEIEADPDAQPPVNPGLEFRFSSRVHDASSAHEVGMYHFWADGRSDFFGLVEAYLVKKDGRWVSLLDIRRGENGRSRAEWDALAGSDS